MSRPTPLDTAEPVSAMGIKLVELETFLAVAETGSFSLAAQRLHVTQPSITSRVQRLEAILGCRLLERTTRKVELTEAGQRLAAEASGALRGLLRLIGEFRQQASEARLRVRVAATPTLAARSLPQVIRAYSERHPQVQVELLDLQYTDALAALDSGAADVLVAAFDEKVQPYPRKLLWSGEMVLVAPAGHPLARHASVDPGVLVDHPLMLIEQYQPMRAHIAEALQARGLSMPPAKIVGNLNTLVGLLDAGMGVTLLPSLIAQSGSAAGHRVVSLQGLELRRDFGLVFPRKEAPGHATSAFCAFLERHLNPEMVARQITP